MHHTSLALRALGELGPRQISLYALYQLQLLTGYLRWQTSDSRRFTDLPDACFRLFPLLTLPDQKDLHSILGETGCGLLLSEAEEILNGRMRLFGGEPVPLVLENRRPTLHWTDLEKSSRDSQEGDIKWAWESARFGWAIVLGRAYWLAGDERYAAAFWKYLDVFLEANPPYYGVQWVSAQEAALRLISIVFAAQIFIASPHSTPDRMVRLGRAIAEHAGRIPPSMAYARAQNNNHLLSEAAGLYTAGLTLQEHPQAAGWRRLGWHWFHGGIISQVSAEGEYTQHSTNYHRLMLQLALWIAATSAAQGQTFPEKTQQRLAGATLWLLDLLDPESGGVPNLGPNDGANILPLTTTPFRDFRPVVQAAGAIFLGKNCLSPGRWDEMGIWLGGKIRDEKDEVEARSANDVIRMEHSWAYLRAARFASRPGHADQLHVDLWWRGINLALDPGSYLYNAPPPWDNSLSRSSVHNTITIDGLDQMTRAGRFLWLDWAQATQAVHERAKDGTWERLTAEHNGYRRLGIIHRRSLTGYRDNRWLVEDILLAYKSQADLNRKVFSVRLHWLLPDWPWELSSTPFEVELHAESPHGQVRLIVGRQGDNRLPDRAEVTLVRAGELVSGVGAADPVLGWYSPTYATKYPALSFATRVECSLPFDITSEWRLPAEKG